MKNHFDGISCLLAIFIMTGCGDKQTPPKKEDKKAMACSDECRAKNEPGELTCKLSSPELKKRKETILKSLRTQVLEKKELQNGYAFRFRGTDQMIDELAIFIKTERECCSFFVFNLSISGDKSEIWLELTGVKGAKDFITNELEL